MSETDDEERKLRIKVMQQDLRLKEKQSRWETPKALAAIIAATAVLFGTLAGLAGYKLGSQPTQPPQIIFQPGAIQVLPR